MGRIEGSPMGGIIESTQEGRVIEVVPVLKPQNIALVRAGEEKRFIDKLPPGMQTVIQQRYPQEDKPKTLSQIGVYMNITRERVRQKEAQALIRIGRLLEGKRQTDRCIPREDVDVADVIRLYTEEKMTEEWIANLKDCSRSTISKLLKAADVPTRSGGRKRMEINISLLVWQYFAKKMSSGKIAGSLGISDVTVLNRLKEAGYQIRGTGPRKK